MDVDRQQPIICREEGVISQGRMKGGGDLLDERQETNKGELVLSRRSGGGGASDSVPSGRAYSW